MPTTTLTRRLSLLAGSAAAVLAAVIPAGSATAAADAPAAPSAKTATAASALRQAPTSKDLSVIADAQNNGYYCGPSAVQNALSALRSTVRTPSQDELARYMGTTSAGTSSVAKTTAAMDHYDTTGFPYVSVYIGGSTATQAQKDKLKHDVVSDISLGHALVANIVGTAYDTAGRSHTYSGGHYITLRGYSSSGAYTHIYDPANDTYYSMETGRLATWIAMRGYTW